MPPIVSIHRVCLLLATILTILVAASRAQSGVVPSGSIIAQASSQFHSTLTAISLTIDGSGMTGDLHDNHMYGHTMWLSVSGGGGSSANNPAGFPGPAWILYQFTQPYLLDEIWVWNHNQENLTDRGLRNVSIHTSVDGTQWSLLGNYDNHTSRT